MVAKSFYVRYEIDKYATAFGLALTFIESFNMSVDKNFSKFIDFIFFNAIIAIALGWGSATVFQATYNYIAHPENGFQLGKGFTFIGGLIGGVVSFLVGYFLFRKNTKTSCWISFPLRLAVF